MTAAKLFRHETILAILTSGLIVASMVAVHAAAGGLAFYSFRQQKGAYWALVGFPLFGFLVAVSVGSVTSNVILFPRLQL